MGRGTRHGVWGAALATLLAGALVLPALAAKDDLDLVSRATGGAPADDGSFNATVSADGRLVAFGTDADNLTSEDDNTFPNVFVRDVQSGVTTLVSRASGVAGAPAGAVSLLAAISADGRFVAFESRADNLSDDDTDGVRDVFVRDLQTSTTTLVSRAGGATGAGGDDESSDPAISPDGRYVAFGSDADNLSSDDNDTVADVFVRDLQANTTTLVSRVGGPGGAGGNDGSSQPAISADGRIVAFQSLADNLSSDDDNTFDNVFTRDLQTNVTTLVSRAGGATGAGGDSTSGLPTISADGRFVAFNSNADNLSAEDDDAIDDVFVRDLQAATTTLASRAPGTGGAGGDGSSTRPSMSADGRFVAFDSLSDNLSGEDGDGSFDVFVRDMQTGTTTFVSRASGPAGAGADSSSQVPAISTDGRFVAFQSLADNLSADDDNDVTNLFRRDVLGPPPPAPPPAPGQPTVTTTATSASCAGQRATIVGTSGRNVIRGTAKRDVIAALGGNDVVRGRGGNDLICLGAGTDRGIGGAGADRILGQSGADRLEGGAGRDRLEGGAGRDLLLGGAGLDRLLGLAGRDTARGGAGVDICRAEARLGC